MTSVSENASTALPHYVAAQRRYVAVPLDEIQRLRDEVWKLRNSHPRMRALFSQLSGLFERLSAGPFLPPPVPKIAASPSTGQRPKA